MLKDIVILRIADGSGKPFAAARGTYLDTFCHWVLVYKASEGWAGLGFMLLSVIDAKVVT